MKKLMIVLMIVAVMLVFAAIAYAGPLGKVGDWIKGNTLAAILSAVLPLVLGIGGGIIMKIIRALKELGEFFVALGSAFEDGNISSKEMSDIFKEGRDVLDIWRTTPERYKVS